MYRSYMDQTLHYFDRPHIGVPAGPVTDRAAWRAEELDRTAWSRELQPGERAWFVEFGQMQAGSARPLGALSRDDIDGSPLLDLIERCRTDLAQGRGFILLRGLPCDDMTVDQLEAAFWGFGLLLGRPGAQNGAGELLGHVRDYRDEPDQPLTREYRTTVDINFHCDAADVVGLLCLAEPSAGGQSRLVSSVEVFNRLLERRPDLAARLCEEVELDTRGDGEGFDHVPVRPTCFDGARLRTFMHLGYFRSAGRHRDVTVDPPLAEALDEWEAIASDPALCLDMDLHRGDIQLCSNHSIAHARHSYVDDPADPRHLLRLWLSL